MYVALSITKSLKRVSYTKKQYKGIILCEGFELAKEEAPRSSMNEGIAYLHKLTEDGRICGARKKECSRVSCSWAAAVYLCNDTDEDQNNVECKAIAESVERLFDECNIRHYPNRNRVLGYQKGPGKLSVHVGRNEC